MGRIYHNYSHEQKSTINSRWLNTLKYVMYDHWACAAILVLITYIHDKQKQVMKCKHGTTNLAQSFPLFNYTQKKT